MGFVIRYSIEFTASGVPLASVSNDVFGGRYIVDASITVSMAAGDSADSFSAQLTNLPSDVAEQLKTALKAPLEAKIFLGYFDEPLPGNGRPVLRALVRSVKTAVGNDGMLVTTVKGTELAGQRLLDARVNEDREGTESRDEIIKRIGKEAKVPVVGTVGGTVDDYTQQSDGLTALSELAAQAGAPLVVRDGGIFIGSGVGAEEFGLLDPDTNLVSLTPRQDVEPLLDPSQTPDEPTQTAESTTLDVKVLGHPDLRVGKNVRITPRSPEDAIMGTLRVNQLTHTFSTSAGYTCEAVLVLADTGALAETTRGAQSLVRRIRDVALGANQDRPMIDVGEIKRYTEGDKGKHLASLTYGQSPPANAVAPSVEQPVNEKPTLHNKPLASPFAWHKCGLVVPVYPGMRALLAHNRGLVNDAIVAGFLWAENPAFERPKNKPGDFWLCLPTELDGNGLPTGKGVNDLTDSAGFRVLQAKGLKIAVGEDRLASVGARPQPPSDQSIEIDHKSGTKVKITADGKVEITTSGKDISISAGSGTVTLKASSVEVKS
jgi:hypothetical protein